MSAWRYGEGRGRYQSPQLWNTEFSRGGVTSISLLIIITGWIRAKILVQKAYFVMGSEKQNHHHTEKSVPFPLEFSITAQSPFQIPHFCCVMYFFIPRLSPLSFKPQLWEGPVSPGYILFSLKRNMQVDFFSREIEAYFLKVRTEDDNVSASCPCLFDLSIYQKELSCWNTSILWRKVMWLRCGIAMMCSVQLPPWKFSKIVLLYYLNGSHSLKWLTISRYMAIYVVKISHVDALSRDIHPCCSYSYGHFGILV